MAIDNAEKRKSISAVVVTSPGVTPNASPDTEWHFQVAYIYSGVAPAITPLDIIFGETKADDLGMYVDANDVGMNAILTSDIQMFVERG